MIQRFRNYIENGPWERHFEEDKLPLVIFSWVAIIFSICWFAPPIIRILIWGPTR
jgi:hypothetical protein